MPEALKDYLHNDLSEARGAVLGKVLGLSEYDMRRPLTASGTNLLGLVKHLATWEARYLGHVFDRPCPEPLPLWDDHTTWGDDHWVTADETSEEVLSRFDRIAEHADATINALDLDSPGHVPWWPRPNVTLFKILVHRIGETNRHAGHADILREQLDSRSESAAENGHQLVGDPACWSDHVAMIEQAAQTAAVRSER